MAGSDLTPFSYLTAPNAELYRAVMGTFVRAKRRFTVHLRPEDVYEGVGGGHEPQAVADALGRLVDWGNLRADPDTSRVTTVEDFHRARFLYQLTRRGEAVEEAIATYDEVLGRRGALQTVALADIATQLRALRELAGQGDPDPAKTYLVLRVLVDRFTDLASNAQAFMSSLQRTIDLHDADVDAFRAYKDRLINYLERFVKDLVSTGSEIAALVQDIEDCGVDRLLDAAAWREGEDAAPGMGKDADGAGGGGAGGADASGEAAGGATAGASTDGAGGLGTEVGDDPRRREFERGRLLWRDRWQGLRGWFLSTRQHPSQARLLRNQARAAVPALLQVVAALNERRTGRSDRSADFRTLARWFAQAPGEAELHRLWRAAFGLSGARHLGLAGEPEPVPASTSWADAPPQEISPRLRRTGSYERRGKPNRVVDRAEQRRYLAELAAREAEQTAAARAALATTHPTRLSDLGTLDPAPFRLFLALLGDALAARKPNAATVMATTSDGSMAVRLTALDDGRRAEIHTPDGVFRGPDHVIEIVDLTAEQRLEVPA